MTVDIQRPCHKPEYCPEEVLLSKLDMATNSSLSRHIEKDGRHCFRVLHNVANILTSITPVSSLY